MKHLGLFAAGVLFGTAGLKILSSKDINERRAAEEDAEVIADASEEKADEE